MSEHVRIDAVDLWFESGGNPLHVLDEIDLTIERGEFVCVVGPSGCGKTTLLSLTSGLLDPTAGEVRVSGTPVTGIPEDVGYLFQKDTLLPWMSVRDNVALPLRTRAGRKPDMEMVDELLGTVGLGGFGDYFPAQLSGGMRKRVQVARLWAQDPGLMLLDEPFGSLDAQTRVLVQEEFLRLWEADRKTVVLVTHDLQEAVLMADRVILLTRRPCRVKASVEVEIERPRRVEEIVQDPRYGELVSTMWASLREEVDLVLGQTIGAETAVGAGGSGFVAP
jgi:NitT/TauT family transport system ATP-binding protein